MQWVDERRRCGGSRRFTGWQAFGILAAAAAVTFVVCWLADEAITVLRAVAHR